MMMGFGVLGILIMVIFWGGLILLGVWVVNTVLNGRQRITSPSQVIEPSARRILDQRYARVEITHEQYKLMKKDLEQN